MTTVFHAWPCGRFIEIQSNLRRKKLHRTNQGSNFLGGNFRNRDNPINIRLGKDVLKTPWRRLQCNIFLSSKTFLRRFQDIITRRLLEDVLKKSSCKHILKTLWRRLENVLKTFLEDVLQTCLQDVLEDEKLLPWRRLQDVWNTSWKTRNVC